MKRRKNSSFQHVAYSALFLMSATSLAWGQDTRISGTRTPLSPDSQLQLKMTSTSSGLGEDCIDNADCNDGNACTIDECFARQCLHESAPECVPCDPGIRQALADLAEMGVTVTPHFFGITEPGDISFSCLGENVVTDLATDVPGELDTCPFPDGTSSFESWGPATAIVAGTFPWEPGTTRIVVPIGDEGPCNGSRPDGCNDPGDDRDSIDNAVAVALANNVLASPIMGTGAEECTINLATLLAEGTGGTLILTENARADIPGAVVQMILDACGDNDPCPPIEVVFVMDTSGSMRDEARTICGQEACNDFNPCTDTDICTDGICMGSPNHDQSADCCNPADGTLLTIDDGETCTDDLCDATTGEVDHPSVANGTTCEDGLFCTLTDTCNDGACAGGPPLDCSFLDDGCFVGACNDDVDNCVSIPADQGTVCNDDELCTATDVCDGFGGCAGTEISTLSCTSDEDCFIAVCDTDTGMCECGDVPDLCLIASDGTLPVTDCHTVGDEITINVELGFSTQLIAGGDIFFEYDPTVLSFIDVVTGQAADPESPFSFELFRMIDEQAGEVFYSVGIEIGDPPTNGPAVMASMRFEAIGACSADAPCWIVRNSMDTTLTDIGGNSIPFTPCCEADIIVNGAAPALTCPNSVTLNADPGTTRATVTWDAPVATSDCDGALTPVCTVTNSFGADIDHLIEGGGVFPTGLSEFRCSAADACGSEGTCAWSVNVSAFNAVEVNLELSPVIDSNPSNQPLRRCIEFEFFSSCIQMPVLVQQTIDFGLPFNIPGHANNVAIKVPAGDYACATARDPKHTLRSVSDLVVVDRTYHASFKGDPFFGGNWLVGGNLDGSNVIDIVDFGLFLEQFITFQSKDTPCGVPGINADFNGDGIVDQLDWSFVSINFLEMDKDACCPGTTASMDGAPITEITIGELRDMGLGHLQRIDLNGDGVLNIADIETFLQRGSSIKSARRRGEGIR